ncbi:ATP-binding protein [bacterium]|nr:MAG: ATP-binding protein [bacterium]
MREGQKQTAQSDVQKKNVETQFAIREAMNKIKHKILVLSGKGGVGKSTVAVNLAYGFAHLGHKVGLLDIDIHGPSIGKMAGIEGQPLVGRKDSTIEPVIKDGIKIVTMASLLPPEDTPVIWRGPMKMKAIDQFLSEINWGELDILVIDSPPGTGDEPLSIIQRLPEMDGAVIVSTPQDVALSDARRTVNFSKTLKIPVLGIIENMSGFICPHCGKRTDIFKTGGGEKAAKEMGLDVLGNFLLEPELMAASDIGKPYILDHKESTTAAEMMNTVKKLAEKMKL